MEKDLPSFLMVAIGICIVLGGIIVGSMVLSTQYPGIRIPGAPYLLLVLAVVIVILAAVVVFEGMKTAEHARKRG
jgi:hypothetical protein